MFQKLDLGTRCLVFSIAYPGINSEDISNFLSALQPTCLISWKGRPFFLVVGSGICGVVMSTAGCHVVVPTKILCGTYYRWK